MELVEEEEESSSQTTGSPQTGGEKVKPRRKRPNQRQRAYRAQLRSQLLMANGICPQSSYAPRCGSPGCGYCSVINATAAATASATVGDFRVVPVAAPGGYFVYVPPNSTPPVGPVGHGHGHGHATTTATTSMYHQGQPRLGPPLSAGGHNYHHNHHHRPTSSGYHQHRTQLQPRFHHHHHQLHQPTPRYHHHSTYAHHASPAHHSHRAHQHTAVPILPLLTTAVPRYGRPYSSDLRPATVMR